MPRKKKDGRFINYYVDRSIYERLERYAGEKSQTMTTALEGILDAYLSRYEMETEHLPRYCPHCHRLTEGVQCMECGRKNLGYPTETDYCFLTEKDPLWAGMLEDCLKSSGIPVITRGNMGAGMTSKVGMLLEQIRFYVPYRCYHQAQALEQELFSGEVGAGEVGDGEDVQL